MAFILNPNDIIIDRSKFKGLAADDTLISCQDRKHCEKWRNCWLPAFSPFPTMFSKGFCLEFFMHGFWQVINPLPYNPDFKPLWKSNLLKTLWQKEKMLETSIFSFPTMFLLFPNVNF